MKKKFLYFVSVIWMFSCEALLVEDISDQSIILLAPSDGVILSSGSIQFDWQDNSEATTYKIQIATPTFNAATQIILDSTTNSTRVIKDLEEGEYQWRVKAMNSDSETPYNTLSFSVN